EASHVGAAGGAVRLVGRVHTGEAGRIARLDAVAEPAVVAVRVHRAARRDARIAEADLTRAAAARAVARRRARDALEVRAARLDARALEAVGAIRVRRAARRDARLREADVAAAAARAVGEPRA